MSFKLETTFSISFSVFSFGRIQTPLSSPSMYGIDYSKALSAAKIAAEEYF